MIKFEARGPVPRWVTLTVPLASIVLALVVAGIVLAATGHNPLTTYRQIVQASITQPGAFAQTLVSMTLSPVEPITTYPESEVRFHFSTLWRILVT